MSDTQAAQAPVAATPGSMLGWAVKAGIPLIAANTTDVVNIEAVLKHLTGHAPYRIETMKDHVEAKTASGKVFYSGFKSVHGQSTKGLYKLCADNGCCLIVLNLPDVPHEYFNAGAIPTPNDLVKTFLMKSGQLSETAAMALLPSLGGLTLKEVAEVYRLTAVSHKGKVDPVGIMDTRRHLFSGVRGITLVNPHMKLYWAQKEFDDYLKSNRSFFLGDVVDPRLRPRGLLLKGTPGTGKTAGAKYAATSWGVPLYRLAANVQEKWVGSSEQNMMNALAQVEAEEPCILLIDEVEKMFPRNTSDSTGVTEKIKSQLLWWLQEHRARVLTIMTCNNADILPPELIRAGRIDGQIDVHGLDVKQAKQFAEALVDTFDFDPQKIDPYELAVENTLAQFEAYDTNGVKTGYDMSRLVPHGTIEEAVLRAMRITLATAPDEAPAATATEPLETTTPGE